MNQRRILLTKDEVKSLGTELTENVTEPIKILYLPITGGDYSSIVFSYWSSSSDLAFTKSYTYSGKTSRIGGSNDGDINLGGSAIDFCWKLDTKKQYVSVGYNQFYAKYINSNTDAMSYINFYINNLYDAYLDAYVAIDVTKVPNIRAYGSSTNGNGYWIGAFFLKYKSGTIPEDTIFYEPGTYE